MAGPPALPVPPPLAAPLTTAAAPPSGATPIATLPDPRHSLSCGGGPLPLPSLHSKHQLLGFLESGLHNTNCCCCSHLLLLNLKSQEGSCDSLTSPAGAGLHMASGSKHMPQPHVL